MCPGQDMAVDGLLAGGVGSQGLRDERLQRDHGRKEPVAASRQRLLQAGSREGRVELSAQLGVARAAGMMRDSPLLELVKRQSRMRHENRRWIGGLCVVSRLAQYLIHRLFSFISRTYASFVP